MAIDRKEFIAALPQSARKTLAAIETARGDAPTVAMSYDHLADTYLIGRASVRYALRILQSVGLIEIGAGKNRVSVFSTSNAWQRLGPAQIARRIAQARLPRPVNGRNRTAEPKPPRRLKPVETEDEHEHEHEHEPVAQYQTPSLPKLRFMGEV